MDEHPNARSSQSSSSIDSAESATAALRLSIDSDRDGQNAPLTNGNRDGHAANGSDGSEDSEDGDLDPVERLQKELERTKGEKDILASQYRTLLSKLTAMRTTLGNKLQQDAVSLPRRVSSFAPHSMGCGLGRTRPARTSNSTTDSGE